MSPLFYGIDCWKVSCLQVEVSWDEGHIQNQDEF